MVDSRLLTSRTIADTEEINAIRDTQTVENDNIVPDPEDERNVVSGS